MAPSESRRTIGVFSHGGTKNLGDEALLATVIQNVRARVPGADVVGFTINPDDTRERHGIAAFPIRQWKPGSPGSAEEPATAVAVPSGPSPRPSVGWKRYIKAVPGVLATVRALRSTLAIVRSMLREPKFLLDSYRRLSGVELLLVAGSQQLNDNWGGVWGFPLTLYKWSLLARLTGTKVAFLSVGAGPVSSRWSWFLYRRVLRSASYRSYRDAVSSRLVESVGVKGPNPVYPDLVYSLKLPVPPPTSAERGTAIVGANPVPYFDDRYWPESDPGVYRAYVGKVSRFVQWLDNNGYSVLLFPTQVRADLRTIQDIRANLNGAGHSPRIVAGARVRNIDDLISEIARADFVIASRYHGILLALALNKPVIGVAYHEKCRALLEMAGQGDYVLDIANFRAEDLIEKFQALQANAEQIKKEISQRITLLREALEEQYDAVFGLIGVAPMRSRKVG